VLTGLNICLPGCCLDLRGYSHLDSGLAEPGESKTEFGDPIGRKNEQFWLEDALGEEIPGFGDKWRCSVEEFNEIEVFIWNLYVE